MGRMYRISLGVFLILCFSLPSIAGEKVYTNKDLNRGPALNGDSKAEQGPGKAIKPKDRAPGSRMKVIVARAKESASILIHRVKTKRMAQAAVIGVIFLIWIAFLIFRISRQE